MSTRLTFRVSHKVRTQFENLQERSGCGTLIQTIRQSVAVYDELLEHVEKGGEVLLKDAEGNVETVKLIGRQHD